jgi:hypothetical protein
VKAETQRQETLKAEMAVV